MLAGEDPRAVIDAVGHCIGLDDGQIKAVFREGHLRNLDVEKTLGRLSRKDILELDRREREALAKGEPIVSSTGVALFLEW